MYKHFTNVYIFNEIRGIEVVSRIRILESCDYIRFVLNFSKNGFFFISVNIYIYVYMYNSIYRSQTTDIMEL